MNNAFYHTMYTAFKMNFVRDLATPASFRTIFAEHIAAAKQTSIEIQEWLYMQRHDHPPRLMQT